MPELLSVDIENFRCFKRLAVGPLTPVNLIVGANNSGKTAFLEAVEALVSEESPFQLYRASYERGEFVQRPDRGEVNIDLGHWFHGHEVDEGASFRFASRGGRERSFARSIARVPPDAGPRFVQGGQLLTVERSGRSVPEALLSLPLTADGFLGAPPPSTFVSFGYRLHPPVGFVTTDRLFSSDLARLWENVVLTPGEERIVEALRIVEPAVERIAIAELAGTPSAKVLLRGALRPIPLGSLGEGVSRMLTLAIHLAVTEGGFLLLDEIENGLHWSVMPKLWRFLVETARTLGVQVFATTHSKDCLEGLAQLHRTRPDLAEDVSVHRLEVGREAPIRFDAARVAELVEMDLEAR